MYVYMQTSKQILFTQQQNRMNIPSIGCKIQNHYKMPLQYVCLHPQCLKNSQQLSCLYCCQQLHQSHIGSIEALKVIMVEFKKAIKPTEFGAAQILLNGIKRCKNQRQLHQNLGELINYQIGGVKFEKIIDKNNDIQKQQTKKFYQDRNTNKVNQNQKTVKKQKKQPLSDITTFINPVLTFSAQDALQQGYEFKSPFCVVNSSQKLVTAFAYPPLNRYQDSVEIDIKIQRITPFWLGIGISLGKKKFQIESKDHILVTSNGWINDRGNLVKTQVKYCLKDKVSVKLDKRMQLVQFGANTNKHTIPLQLKWNQDAYLCCVLFYKEDSVQIMA